MTFIAGCGEVLPGLERRLYGLQVGEEVEFDLPAREAFGEYNPENVQTWSRKAFPPDLDLQVGQKFLPASLPIPPEFPLVVKDIHGDTIILDLNHPFAGHDLRYQVKVMEVRPATAEEMEPLKQCKSCREDTMCGT
jgi:FKBP-type peptidyl-prolyl cis-trans isomerase SlyD